MSVTTLARNDFAAAKLDASNARLFKMTRSPGERPVARRSYFQTLAALLASNFTSGWLFFSAPEPPFAARRASKVVYFLWGAEGKTIVRHGGAANPPRRPCRLEGGREAHGHLDGGGPMLGAPFKSR